MNNKLTMDDFHILKILHNNDYLAKDKHGCYVILHSTENVFKITESYEKMPISVIMPSQKVLFEGVEYEWYQLGCDAYPLNEQQRLKNLSEGETIAILNQLLVMIVEPLYKLLPSVQDFIMYMNADNLWVDSSKLKLLFRAYKSNKIGRRLFPTEIDTLKFSTKLMWDMLYPQEEPNHSKGNSFAKHLMRSILTGNVFKKEYEAILKDKNQRKKFMATSFQSPIKIKNNHRKIKLFLKEDQINNELVENSSTTIADMYPESLRYRKFKPRLFATTGILSNSKSKSKSKEKNKDRYSSKKYSVFENNRYNRLNSKCLGLSERDYSTNQTKSNLYNLETVDISKHSDHSQKLKLLYKSKEVMNKFRSLSHNEVNTTVSEEHYRILGKISQSTKINFKLGYSLIKTGKRNTMPVSLCFSNNHKTVECETIDPSELNRLADNILSNKLSESPRYESLDSSSNCVNDSNQAKKLGFAEPIIAEKELESHRLPAILEESTPQNSEPATIYLKNTLSNPSKLFFNQNNNSVNISKNIEIATINLEKNLNDVELMPIEPTNFAKNINETENVEKIIVSEENHKVEEKVIAKKENNIEKRGVLNAIDSDMPTIESIEKHQPKHTNHNQPLNILAQTEKLTTTTSEDPAAKYKRFKKNHSKIAEAELADELECITLTKKEEIIQLTQEEQITNKEELKKATVMENRLPRKQSEASSNRVSSKESEKSLNSKGGRSIRTIIDEYLHFINKIGEAVAKTSKISAKLDKIEWFTGIYFLYKRFYRERKLLVEWLQQGIPKVARKSNELDIDEWNKWLETSDKQELIAKLSGDNKNVEQSITKMHKKIMTKKLPGQVLYSAHLNFDTPINDSKLAVEFIVDEYDQAEELNMLQDTEVTSHLSDLVNALYAVAELDGKITTKSPLSHIFAPKKPETLKNYVDKIFDLYNPPEN